MEEWSSHHHSRKTTTLSLPVSGGELHPAASWRYLLRVPRTEPWGKSVCHLHPRQGAGNKGSFLSASNTLEWNTLCTIHFKKSSRPPTPTPMLTATSSQPSCGSTSKEFLPLDSALKHSKRKYHLLQHPGSEAWLHYLLLRTQSRGLWLNHRKSASQSEQENSRSPRIPVNKESDCFHANCF